MALIFLLLKKKINNKNNIRNRIGNYFFVNKN